MYLFFSKPKHQSGELGVSCDHEGQGDIQQVFYHCVLFLTPTVVLDVLLAKPMYFKEVMEHADNGIGSLINVSGLVNQVVYLTWDSLTAHSIFPWC